MQCYQCVAIGEAILWQPARNRQEPDEGVDHNIADAVNLFRRNSFSLKIDVTIFGRSKEQVRELVGEKAVDFLRHGAIKGAQPGLDMTDAGAELGAYHRGCNRGI